MKMEYGDHYMLRHTITNLRVDVAGLGERLGGLVDDLLAAAVIALAQYRA